ncbi:MAG: hypothetical protein HFE62_04335 [Firmicutes bacterium]|nr:hypothetical protein [Bacillota bacterium]
MIDFSDEIKKYEPILEVGDIEDSIHSTDLKDIMDMLNYISKNKEDAKRVSNVSPKGKWD